MIGAFNMNKKIVNASKTVYNLENRNIKLDSELASKYEQEVCPISDGLLSSLIHVFGKNCTDQVLSYKIELDMAKELNEYAV